MLGLVLTWVTSYGLKSEYAGEDAIVTRMILGGAADTDEDAVG